MTVMSSSAVSKSSQKRLWYRNFRTAAYISTIGSLAWTVLIILPFRPFSYIPPIIAGGGPGTWFLFGYVLYLTIGLGGFGGLSTFLYTIEMHEYRRVDNAGMSIGFTLLLLGETVSCILLGVVGALGGYALTINSESVTYAQNLLSPFVYPITFTTLIAVIGAALTILAMARAKVVSN
jgi:hypothetical protein